MEIPKNLLNKWRELKMTGDYDAIQTRGEISASAAKQAFYTGKCSRKVYDEIADYFHSKKKERERAIRITEKKNKEVLT